MQSKYKHGKGWRHRSVKAGHYIQRPFAALFLVNVDEATTAAALQLLLLEADDDDEDGGTAAAATSPGSGSNRFSGVHVICAI